jgi:uncharacterized protein YjiS (DUF1127 family)
MLLLDLTRAVRGWIRSENHIRRLRWLDDRLLADIGVCRHDIVTRVRGRRQ